MKLFILSQDVNNGYDTYDSLVVCAKSEEDAKTIPPHGDVFKETDEATNPFNTWAYKLDNIRCIEIGNAGKTIQRGLILASFNAG